MPNDDEDLVELQVVVSVSLRPVTVRLPRELADKVMGGEVGKFDEIAEADANGGWDNFLDMLADEVTIDDATIVAPSTRQGGDADGGKEAT